MRGDVLQKVKRLVSVVVVLNLAFGGFLGLILIVDDNVVEGPLQIPDPVGDTIYVDTGDDFTWDGSDIPNGTLDLDNNLVIRNGGQLRIINATIIFQSDIDHRYSLLVDNGGILRLENSTITIQTTDLFDNYENVLWFNYSRGVSDPAPSQETYFRRLIPFTTTIRDSSLYMSKDSALRYHGDLYIDNSVVDIADSVISSPEFHHMSHDWGIVVQIVDCDTEYVTFADSRIEKSPWYQGIEWHDPDSGDVNTDPIMMFANHTVSNSNRVSFINTYFDIDYLNKTSGSLYEETKDDHHPPGINPEHNALNIYNSNVRFFGLTIDMSETSNQIPLDGSTAIEVKDVTSTVALYRWLYVYPVDNQIVPVEGSTVDITSWYTGNTDIDVLNNINSVENVPVKNYLESLRGGTYSQPNAQTVRCVTGGSGIAVFGLLSDLLTDTGWPNSDQKDGYNIDASYNLPPLYTSDGTVEFENFPRVFDWDNYVNYLMDPFDFAAPHPELYPEFVTTPPTTALEGVSVNINVDVWNEIIGIGEDATNVRVQFWDGDPEVSGSVMIGENIIPSITAGTSETTGIVWNPTPTGAHKIYIGVDRDWKIKSQDNLIPEINEDNNVIIASITVLERPDLFINATDIQFIVEDEEAEVVVNGTTVQIRGFIKNLGGSTAQNVVVNFYDGTIAGPGDFIDSTTISSIPAGATQSASVGWLPNEGVHYVWIIVDELDVIPETNEGNNEASSMLTVMERPDLVPTLVMDPVSPVFEGEEVTLNAVVANDGGWNVTVPVYVRFYKGDPNNESNFIGDDTIPIGAKGVSVPTGGSGTASIIWIAYPPSDHEFWVVVDPYNDIKESDETNNRDSSGTYTVNPRPNLVVEASDIVFSDPYPMEGDNINVQVTIWNKGLSPITDTFDVQVWLDEIGGSGTLLSTLTIGAGIGVGGSVTDSFNWNNVGPFGNHKVYVNVDIPDLIDETNEDDNTVYTNLVIIKIPSDLVVNDSLYGTLTIENYFDTDDPWTRGGFTLIEGNNGHLIIRNSICKVVGQTEDDEFNIVVKDTGTLTIEDGSTITTDGKHVNIYLYDSATLNIDSSVIDTMVDIIAYDNADIIITDGSTIKGQLYATDDTGIIEISATNSSFTNNMNFIGGNTEVDLWGVNIGSDPANVDAFTVADNAKVFINWYLTVTLIDINPSGYIQNADVTWKRSAPWSDQMTAQTGEDGMVNFWLRGMNITSTNIVWDIGSYQIDAEYTYNLVIYNPDSPAAVDMDKNKEKTLQFSQVMPDLDPPLVIDPNDTLYAVGSPSTVKAWIYNNGTNAAYDVWVKFLDNRSESRFPYAIKNEEIPAGDVWYIEFEWIPELVGWHNISIEVDPNDLIIEGDEENNYNYSNIYVTPQKADLYITGADISFTYPTGGPTENDTVYIQVTIYNDGETNAFPAPKLTVEYWTGNAGGPVTLLGWGNISGVVAGSFAGSSFVWTSTTPPGNYFIWVLVDPDDKVEETNEFNNTAFMTMDIKRYADVRPIGISFSVDGVPVTSAEDNDQVTITATVDNIGQTDASMVSVQFFDGDPDAGADSIGAVQTISKIEVNKTGTASVVWTATVDGKIEVHSIFVVVSGVKENYKDNNEISTDITVTLRPILSVLDISFSDDSPLTGEVIQIYATVQNTGGTDTTDFFVAFFDGDPDLGADQIGGNKQLNLPVDGTGTVDVSFSSAIRGAHEIFVVADVRDDIDEADETNNIATEVIAVYSSANDIIVNDANTPYTIDDDFDHRGYTLVEEHGVLTISDATFRVLQSNNYQYNIIVRNNGTLILEDNTVLDTDGVSFMRMYLYDDSTLIIEDAVISSNIIEIQAFGNSKIYINGSTVNSYIKATSAGANVQLYAMNSSLSQPFQYFGGSSMAEFTNVFTPSVVLSNNAQLHVYKWLKVYVRDGAGGPKTNAVVEVRHKLPPHSQIDGSPKTTGSNGLALFPVLTDIITPTSETSYLNYDVYAEFNRSGETYTGSEPVSFSSYLIDKSNNIEEVSIYLMELLPDFFVDMNSITFEVGSQERLTVGIGEVVTITATVQNIGTTDAEGVLVRFFIDLDQDGLVDANELIDEAVTTAIPADGGEGDASVIWIPSDDDEGDNRWIRITVDPYDTVLELNEGDDNRAIITLDIVTPPDLAITNDDIYFKTSGGRIVDNATEGELMKIELRIKNLGNNPATNVNVSAFNGWPDANYDGKPDDPLPPGVQLIDDKIVLTITPGTHTVTLSWDTTQKEGDHFIYVFVNDATLINGYPIPDQKLSNNHAEKDFIVHAKPDLYVTVPSPFTTNVTFLDPGDLNVIITNPEIGQDVIMRTTIFNYGQVYLSNVMVSFYDGDPEAGGILLGNDTVDLAPTSSANATIEWIINAPIGEREFFVWVNRDLSVLESEYDNNIVSDIFTVEFADYDVEWTVIPDSTYNVGKPIQIRAEARFTDTDEALAGMSYNITILHENTLEPYGDTREGVTNFNGAIYDEVAAPTSAGDYLLRVEVSYGEGTVFAQHSFSVEEEEEPLIPLWLLLLVILIAVVVVLLVGVALAKFGLGRLVECGECGAFIPEGEKACPKCGAVFETDTAKCSECGAWIPVESKSCPDCGAIFAGLEKEKKDYIERMKVQYQEYVDQYKGEARADLGKEPTTEEFNDWWKANPKYVGFEEWLAREEELRKGRTKNCPSCNSINPESAAICYKCGTVFGEEEEEEEEEEEMPPPEVPAKRVARPEERRAAPPQTVVPKKVTRPPETVPKKVVKTPPTVVPKKVVRPPEEGKTVVVPKKVVKRPPPEEE
jgi:subtilase family serine protease